MIITLTSDSKESLNQKTADLAAILVDRTVHIIHEPRFIGYNELGVEQWQIELEVVSVR